MNVTSQEGFDPVPKAEMEGISTLFALLCNIEVCFLPNLFWVLHLLIRHTRLPSKSSPPAMPHLGKY